MFPGSPARIRPTTPLHSLVPLAAPDAVLGVWLRGSLRPLAARCRGPDGARHLLLAADLGYLLGRCGRVALRDGESLFAAPAGRLLAWRVLEIVLATPYLPSAAQLRLLFPSAKVRDGIVTLPLGLGSPEEALALCADEQVRVTGTRIAYRPSVDALPAGSLG